MDSSDSDVSHMWKGSQVTWNLCAHKVLLLAAEAERKAAPCGRLTGDKSMAHADRA